MSENDKQELAEAKNTLPVAFDYEQLAGEGNDFEQDDLTTPFLKLLQKTSPELDDNPDARAGMFVNTATGELFSDPPIVIPVAYERQFLEWVPTDDGGGFRGQVPKSEALKMPQDERGNYLAPNGNHVVDTRVHYVLHLTDDGPVPCIMTFKSTGIKRSKNWNDLVRNIKIPGSNGKPFNPPMFSHTYVVGFTDEEKNGNKWKLPKVAVGSLVEDEELFRTAIEFREIIKSGAAKVDYAQSEDGGAESGGNTYDEDDEF